jgi:diguanylate cyclase (GGDEF)-like protein
VSALFFRKKPLLTTDRSPDVGSLLYPVAQFFLKQPILLVSLLTTGLIMGIRHQGWLQPLELIGYDQLVRLQPKAEADPRLLIVGVSEADIQALQEWPLSDQVLAEALSTLQQYQPQAIGLDIYRDIPHGPGHEGLLQQLRAANVISIETYGQVPPPPTVASEQIGFNDLVVDPDGVVRRNLMFAQVEGEAFHSFSLRLSLAYLAERGLPLQMEADGLRLGSTWFPVLQAHAGGYQTIDDSGYQVMLRYRSAEPLARQISLTQVLEQQFQPDWVKDKIVLIGATASSAKDNFFTPYTGTQQDAIAPGVLIHAQMTSQILSTVLDQRTLLWFWPEWLEILWIGGWIVLGGILAWRLQHPLAMVLGGGLAVAALGGLGYGIFLQAGWVPLVAPLMGLVISETLMVSCRRIYDVTHDLVTGLPNRQHLIQQLTHEIARHQHRASDRFAVFFLSLNRLNIVNESLGFEAGDHILRIMVNRLKQLLPRYQMLARVGDNEFAVLLDHIKAVQDVTTIADCLSRELSQPFEFKDQSVFLTCSIGIALSQPGQPHQPEDLLRDAHTAMYRAKQEGKSRHAVFAVGMREAKLVQMQLEADLHQAVEQQAFFLNYQPIVALQTGRIAGFEALVRWQHPQKGLISPSDFIPVAEETGLIVPLGQWILETACQQMAVWQRQFPDEPPLLISINLSPGQFAQPNLVPQIQAVLQATGLPPQSVKLEITESMVMENVEGAIDLLLRLKALNLKLGIDDFGTGYSSLSYLTRFPVDTLKIDRSFVSSMEHVSSDTEIVRTIIMLGHNLKMDIIAEGVESPAQLSILRTLGCEYAQGYFMSKPIGVEQATALLQTKPTW